MLLAALLLLAAKALAQSAPPVFQYFEPAQRAIDKGTGRAAFLTLQGLRARQSAGFGGGEADARRTQHRFLAEAGPVQTTTLQTRYWGREQPHSKARWMQYQIWQRALSGQTLLSCLACALALLWLSVLGLVYQIFRTNRSLAAYRLRLLQAHQLEAFGRKGPCSTAKAMLHGQDAERSRMARDLHDSLGAMLSTVKHYLGAMHRNLQLPADRETLFLKSLQHLDGCIEELRRVANDMMPAALQRFGLVPALQNICNSLNTDQPPCVRFQTYGLEHRLPEHAEVVVYRLVQELVNNAVKHAVAQQIIVQLTHYDGHLQLVVEDDGCGFRPATTQAGMGLRNIQVRADYLRGSIDWYSAPGQGTTATVAFPFPNE